MLMSVTQYSNVTYIFRYDPYKVTIVLYRKTVYKIEEYDSLELCPMNNF